MKGERKLGYNTGSIGVGGGGCVILQSMIQLSYQFDISCRSFLCVIRPVYYLENFYFYVCDSNAEATPAWRAGDRERIQRTRHL